MTKRVALPKQWHKPANKACPHNKDPFSPCLCKRKRTKKPYREFRMTDPNAPRGIRPTIICRVFRNGLMQFREMRRRKKYEATVGQIYADLAHTAAVKAAAAARRGK